MNVIDEVVACSSRPQVAFRWINELLAKGACYENFRETTYEGRICMATLDAKLASALAHAAPEDFQRTLQARKHEALNNDQPVFNSSPEKRLMIVMASSSSTAEAAPPALPPAPAEEMVQYGPQRTVLKRIMEVVTPFAPAERPREHLPRRILGEMKTEVLAAERRSHALESELSEAVEVFRARDKWWMQGLLELQDAVGTERSRFEQLAQNAESEFQSRLSTLEGSVNRSQREVRASEQSIQQYHQNLLELESFTQQLQEDEST